MISLAKKKKKKKIVKEAKRGMKILKSGKIKIGGEKLDLSPFIANASEDAIVSRLDAIISKEDVAVEDGEKICDTETILQGQLQAAELEAHIANVNGTQPFPRTVVVVIPKKDAVSSFDFLNPGILGDILRSSTLASTYKTLKEEWVELNEKDTTNFTNVLYVPKVMMMIDMDTGKFKGVPYYVNVLILAVPAKSKINGDVSDKVTDEDAVERILTDITESCIRLAVKTPVIDPFCFKWLEDDLSMTSEKWQLLIDSNKVQEHFDLITFTFEDENKFIIFSGNVMKSATL